MRFYTFGNCNKPAIIMLSGSFCPADSMVYLYDRLKENYYIIVPEYNGHYENSRNFTTRQREASEIKKYIQENKLLSLELVYGQSMGAEMAIELISQLLQDKITVKHAIFDGAPCVRLSRPYRFFMYQKFKTLISMMRNKSVDDVIQWKFLNKFSGGDTESFRSALVSAKRIAPYITEESIRNESECCYTFDFPKFSPAFQKHMHFFYAREEKAYRACYKYVKKAYPEADYRVESGYGHLTYSIKRTEEYLSWISDIMNA